MVYSTFSERSYIYGNFFNRLNEHPKVNAMLHGISSGNWGNPFSEGGFGRADYWKMIHVTPAKGSDITPDELTTIIQETMGELPEKVPDPGRRRFGLFPQIIKVRDNSFIEPAHLGAMVKVFIGRQPTL